MLTMLPEHYARFKPVCLLPAHRRTHPLACKLMLPRAGAQCCHTMLPTLCCHTQEHYAKYEPTILELKRKYELMTKEKMLATIERDKMIARVRITSGCPRQLGVMRICL